MLRSADTIRLGLGLRVSSASSSVIFFRIPATICGTHVEFDVNKRRDVRLCRRCRTIPDLPRWIVGRMVLNCCLGRSRGWARRLSGLVIAQ